MSNKKVTSKDFTDLLQGSLSKEFKDTGLTFRTPEDRSERINPTMHLSTGDPVLDLIISNKKNAGIPFGRYVNIYSDSGLGKSLLVQKLIANVQRMGGTAVYFDTEGGIYYEFMKVLGVKTDELVYIDDANAIEDIFQAIIQIIVTNIENDIDNPLLIAVDSMTATTTRDGAKLDSMEQKGYGEGARKQLILNDLFKKALTKIKQDNIILITTDQIRDKINASPWERNWRNTAGWAQKFYSDIRLEMTPRGAIKNKNKDIIGNKVNIKVVKSRISPSDRSMDAYIYGTRGLDKYKSLLETAKDRNIIKKGRDKIKFKIDGEEYRKENGNLPTEMEFKRMLKEDKKIYDLIYDQLAENMVIEYEFEDELIDDDENIIEEEDTKSDE